MKEHMIVPDAHFRPGECNDRAEWAMQFALDRRPDTIVIIGDWADMGSLSYYDVGKVSGEGKRYVDDIQASNDALTRFMEPLVRYNSKRKRNKKSAYTPDIHLTLGNHENRISRANNDNPSLFGAISLEDFNFKSYGITVHPFLEPVELDGICYKHYHTSGIMGRPIGGDNHAASLVKKAYKSTVVGHSHMRDFWETSDICGKKIFGLVVGCYTDHPHEYTTEQERWWSGLVYLHDVNDGQAEPEFLTIDWLRRKYGN